MRKKGKALSRPVKSGAQKKNKVKITEKTESAETWDSDSPATITDGYWVFATSEVRREYHTGSKREAVPVPTNNAEINKYVNERKTGKWLVFVDISELDSTWKKVKKATKKGLLGGASKAATAKPNPNASSPTEKVICVYTYNWLDKEDVFRVEKALRLIGIKKTLYYKTDNDSLQGKYKNRGNQNISKYISKGTENYANYPLRALNGIGYHKNKILNNIGIQNFNDLLAFDTGIKLKGMGASAEYINKLKLLALSQVENKILRLSPFKFPENDIIHFDIETDIYTPHDVRRVWSIAVHHNKKVTHFYAESWEMEEQILRGFITYIKANKNAALFSYSGFDVSVLKFALKRHKLDVEFFLSRNHFDLCAILKQNYVLPLDSYSIKVVGEFFGYRYKYPDLDGLRVAMEYMSNQGPGQKISKKLFHYIQDDVKVMHHVMEKIKTWKDIKDIFEHTT